MPPHDAPSSSPYTYEIPCPLVLARFKQVVGDRLRSRKDQPRATEVDVAVHALNRMLGLVYPISVCIA